METGTTIQVIVVPLSSYRTYEEWKLLRELVSYEVRCVLTVPMRNGNLESVQYFSARL